MTTKNTTTIWGILMALVIAVIAAPVADAARAMRPHGNSTDSISLRVTNDINGDTLPGWGDTITFDMSTTASHPIIEVLCSQNGVMVYSAYMDMVMVTMPKAVSLGSTMWQSGAADCTAYLKDLGGKFVLAVTNFSATE